MTDLLELKGRLRRLPKAGLQSLTVVADELAAGYLHLRSNAPRRAQGYLSASRRGITTSRGASTRLEEHLAAGIFLRGSLLLPNGEQLQLLDYQFPLKAVRTDAGIGKVDLLGLDSDGTIVIVELKVEGNSEDRRIALLEGLIYAAIVEANLEKIAAEVLDKHGRRVALKRPRILVVAPPVYWLNANSCPPTAHVQELSAATSKALSGEIQLLRLTDANLVEYSLDGRPPRIEGRITLSLLTNDA